MMARSSSSLRSPTLWTPLLGLGDSAVDIGGAGQGQLNELGDQVGVVQAGDLPHVGVHGEGGEAGHRVDLVDHRLTGIGEEEVDSGQALAADCL